jgi:Tfp pilus assembly protein PilF
VPPTVKQPFDVGVGHLRSGNYPAAEQSFKEALKADGDTTGPLVYLAVCFAAAGHDFEASSAWQTALARASDLAQIYHWLSEALLRAHEMARAQSILEEAIRRWPDDSRFTKPLAMLYATVGRGDEAFRLHERYIAAGHTDADTMYRALEWIVQVHSSGRVVHTRAEDVALARSYADTYAKLNGPKRALVRQWVSYLERAQR